MDVLQGVELEAVAAGDWGGHLHNLLPLLLPVLEQQTHTVRKRLSPLWSRGHTANLGKASLPLVTSQRADLEKFIQHRWTFLGGEVNFVSSVLRLK